MTHKFDANTHVSTNAEIYFDGCADPLQTGGILKILSRASRGLRLWAAAQLIAHHNRVFALGVYRRSRVDGSRTIESKT